jgi:hypothetical protein
VSVELGEVAVSVVAGAVVDGVQELLWWSGIGLLDALAPLGAARAMLTTLMTTPAPMSASARIVFFPIVNRSPVNGDASPIAPAIRIGKRSRHGGAVTQAGQFWQPKSTVLPAFTPVRPV